jgi:hypothetical protein
MVYLSHLLSGRVSSAVILHHGHSMSIHTDMSMGIIEQCMKTDALLKESVAHTQTLVSTVLQILKQDLKIHKIVVKWVPHHFSEVQLAEIQQGILYQSETSSLQRE